MKHTAAIKAPCPNTNTEVKTDMVVPPQQIHKTEHNRSKNKEMMHKAPTTTAPINNQLMTASVEFEKLAKSTS